MDPNTQKLIKEVRNLLNELAGTEVSQSQTVIEIQDAIYKLELQEQANGITSEWINNFKSK